MKKLISLIMVFSIISMLFCPNVFADGTQIILSNSSCNAGEDVEIEVSMPLNTGVVSVQLEIVYDNDLVLTEVIDGGILGEYNHSNKLESPYVLSWENDRITENLISTGKLATFKFKVSPNAKSKNYPITIVRAEVLDKDINDVECNVVNGNISVKSQIVEDLPTSDDSDAEIIPQPDKEPATNDENKIDDTVDKDDNAVKDDVVNDNVVTYADVSSTHWFYDYVIGLSKKGIVSGDGTGNFVPNNNVTREQFLKMLLLATGIKIDEAENTFDDVDNSAWYREYVLSAKKAGIVNGIDDKQFGIGLNITRQDMAVMISRTIEKLGLKSDAGQTMLFADDNKVSGYAKDSVTYMRAIGLIEGYNNEFRPLDNLTRAEAAKVISELIKLI